MISFVTGASGFIGSHLVEHLLTRGDTVVAFQRKTMLPRERLRVVEGDVLDAELLARAIRENAPQEIYHLAAQSLPNASWEQPGLTHRVNVEGALNVLEAVRVANISPAILVTSSSSVYAQNPDGTPIKEDDRCHPANPYAVSKLAADHLSRLYAERYKLRVVVARPFFLIGPRKAGDVCSDWARDIVAIERAGTGNVAVGNLDIERDFLHVVDGVEALVTIAAKGKAGDAYNVCSGRGWNLRDVLGVLTRAARAGVSIRSDPSRVRPIDERVKIGDASKLGALGWRERRTVDAALEEILHYWRTQR
jgi:GDP-4-dehydro-6-deoxy-D-mannose reductase